MTGFPIDLEQARKRAKELLRAARAGDGEALARIGTGTQLADAQRTVARELGFADWPALKHAVEAERSTFDARVQRFVEDATEARFDRARRGLAHDPAIAGAGLVPALLLGDAGRVEEALRADPELPRRTLPPRGWTPLLYACHSCFLGRDAGRTVGLVEIVRLLLDAGADPNATAPSPNWPGSTWTPLYGAAGVAYDAATTRLLLAAGADPDDNESVYHACESRDHAALLALVEAGAAVNGTNALPHMLDYDDLEGARILLDAGADPNESGPGAALRHAVLRGRGPGFVELLAAHGAVLDGPDEEGLTAYRLAARRGRTDTLAALARLGADTTTTQVDDFLGACASGDEPRVQALLAARPGLVGELSDEERSLVVELSTFADPTPVRVMLDAGFPVEGRGGGLHGTALHYASWHGRVPTVELLLERGADVEATTGMELSTPLGWACHGSREAPRGGDWLGVAERLVAAGGRIEPGFADAADDELAEWLADRLEPGR